MISALFVVPKKKICTTLFLECSHVQAFWSKFTSWWCDLVKENIRLKLKEIILGLPNRIDILNYLIILGKLCIWECRKACTCPNFDIFLKELRIKIETEIYTAMKNGALTNFRKRWEAILSIFV